MIVLSFAACWCPFIGAFPFFALVSQRRLPWIVWLPYIYIWYIYVLGIYSIFNKANYTSKKTGPKDQGENQSDPYLKAWPKLVNEVAEVAEGHRWWPGFPGAYLAGEFWNTQHGAIGEEGRAWLHLKFWGDKQRRHHMRISHLGLVNDSDLWMNGVERMEIEIVLFWIY